MVWIGVLTITRTPKLTSAERQVLMDLNEKAYVFREYNTTDMSDFDPHPRHELCAYSPEQDKIAQEHKIEKPCDFWNQTQNAKYRFRLLSLKARAIASPELLTALNRVEAGFDQAFDTAIRTDSYNKWPSNEYTNTMTPRIEAFETAIREDLQ